MEKFYKILFSTDQHFNHPRLDPVRQVQRFNRLMLRAIREHEPDAVVLGGDWFDRPTSMTSTAGVAILDAMMFLVSLCHSRGIALRVLKGTGTHDGVQNDNWKPLADKYPRLDFAYYKDVDVINDLGGFNILTIPDSTIPNHHKCEMEVRAKMAERGLKTVHLGITHGMYTHHLAEAGFKVEAHDSEYYASIIDIVCLNGHIHTPSLHDVFLTGGSTDRDRQGENHAKGIHLVTINKAEGTFTATFIENEDAAVFNSYEITDADPTIAVDRLSPIFDRLTHPDTFVRLHYHADVPIRAIEKKLTELYPKIRFDSVPNDKAVKELKKKRELELAEDIPEGITPDTLVPLMGEKFGRLKLEFTDEHKRILQELSNGA